jgi:hypothetical protein
MTSGADRVMPDPSPAVYSCAPPGSSQFDANVDIYAVTACPYHVRPQWQFLRCDMTHRDQPYIHPGQIQSKSGQPQGHPERHTGIRIAPCDRIRRRKTIEVSGHVSCRTVPVGGISMSMSNGKHRLPYRNNVDRRCHRLATTPFPGGHSALPDLRHLRSRQAALPSLTHFWPVHALPDSKDSALVPAGLCGAAITRQRERKLTDAR